MNPTYMATARLLTEIAPVVFESGIFALKGGTAINLFLRNVPRLSVDLECNVSEDIEIESSRREDQIGLQLVAGLQQHAPLSKRLDLVRDYGCLAGGNSRGAGV